MGPGRPKFIIEEEALLQFRSLGFTWKDSRSVTGLTLDCVETRERVGNFRGDRLF